MIEPKEFELLTKEDEGKVYWIAGFGLNSKIFGAYATNLKPVQAIISDFAYALQDLEYSKKYGGKFFPRSWDVLKKDGTVSNKTVTSGFLSSRHFAVCETEAEAYDAYTTMVEDAMQIMNDYVRSQEQKLQNTLQEARRKQAQLR